jgi:two-component SAPR family response regulator
VRAFEVNAADYLLKPVEKGRLREAINRARERIEHAEIVAEQGVRVGAAIGQRLQVRRLQSRIIRERLLKR